MSDKQIALKLGVSSRSFIRYKKKHKELRETLIAGRQDIISKARSKIIDTALNGIVTTTIETIDDGDSVKTITRTRSTSVDVTCLLKVLNNYDPDWHSNDSKTMKIREKELNLKDEKIKNDKWS